MDTGYGSVRGSYWSLKVLKFLIFQGLEILPKKRGPQKYLSHFQEVLECVLLMTCASHMAVLAVYLDLLGAAYILHDS